MVKKETVPGFICLLVTAVLMHMVVSTANLNKQSLFLNLFSTAHFIQCVC